MKNRFFMLTNITNMHPGTGEKTASAIDKHVQRDVVTSAPIIYSQSLKGAFRDFAKECCDGDKIASEAVEFIFGTPEQPGECRFLDARLLALPVRSNCRPYYLGICPELLEEFISLARLLDIPGNLSVPANLLKLQDNKAHITEPTATGKFIENLPCEHLTGLGELQEIFGTHLAFFSYKTFKDILLSLPVMARNAIGEDGTSENLFHEEFVPRQTRFGFFIGIPDESSIAPADRMKIKEWIDAFIQLLTTKAIQIGGDYSIGDGIVTIKEKVSL